MRGGAFSSWKHSLYSKMLLICKDCMRQLYQKIFAPQESKFIPFRVVPISKGRADQFQESICSKGYTNTLMPVTAGVS